MIPLEVPITNLKRLELLTWSKNLYVALDTSGKLVVASAYFGQINTGGA